MSEVHVGCCLSCDWLQRHRTQHERGPVISFPRTSPAAINVSSITFVYIRQAEVYLSFTVQIIAVTSECYNCTSTEASSLTQVLVYIMKYSFLEYLLHGFFLSVRRSRNNRLTRSSRTHWALRLQKPLRFIRDGEVGGSGIFISHLLLIYTVTTRMILQ